MRVIEEDRCNEERERDWEMMWMHAWHLLLVQEDRESVDVRGERKRGGMMWMMMMMMMWNPGS